MNNEHLPECGLYKTVQKITLSSITIQPGHLVFFHNHSSKGNPIILLPVENRNNRWDFGSNGYQVEKPGILGSLKPLKEEGLYSINKPLKISDGKIIPKNHLVQLGYNSSAEPIIFFPEIDPENNTFKFPVDGMKIPESVYQLLTPLALSGAVDMNFDSKNNMMRGENVKS